MKKEIECVEVVPVEVRAIELESRLDRVAEALYPLLTSPESIEKLADSDEIHSSSIHRHKQTTAGGTLAPEKDVSDGKDEPKTAA